ncbi:MULTISPECIES: D-alanyl-D-alanine carboxypeptidase family protein [unclassified Aureimonas]|uniref:D-alanyl-D-alanine carboxypeptidase family protein n=1 Tax=unclassified Aureimonas TaxID=2615206 RepID=UPI0009EA688A|nr:MULTISPECIES: D-alanyl-D-alanine carboxypeptidase family protein [unclassified Aureimonas]
MIDIGHWRKGLGREGLWRDGLGRKALAPLLALALVACQSADLSGPTSPLDPASLAEGSFAEPEIRAASAYVVDAGTGRVLLDEAGEAPRYPASLTKMMTLHLLFDAVAAGRLSLDSDLLVSPFAASRAPSKLGLRAGETIKVRDAAQALAVKSANDAATVIAENLAGSEAAFAVQMNAKARAIGMRRTRFVNASGLPQEGQVTTARDMATLALSLRGRHPRFAPYFAATEFTYAGKTYKATNKLLGQGIGVDGMKTGFIRDSGFHLVASAGRGGHRIVVVVMGGVTGKARDARVAALVAQYL